jgi:predicted CopG family antitoxin
MPKLDRLSTISVSRENYLDLEGLGSAGNSFDDVVSEILKQTSLLQIRSGLATAIESEAGATRIFSEDDLGHEF